MNRKEYNAAWYQANKDRVKAKSAQYYAENKEKQSEVRKAWKTKNAEAYGAYLKQYTEQNRAASLVNKAKSRAKKKQAICTITKEWVQTKIDIGVCELTRLPFELKTDPNKKVGLYAPSLDRIDNNNPNYTPENVRVVIWGVNMMRNEYEFDELIPIMKAILSCVGK